MAKVKIGILGVGEMGQRHAENICRLNGQAELVAVTDISQDRAARVANSLGVKKSFGSLEAMLEEAEIQAVVIATPDKFHAAAVETVALAGKDILCEKPLALSYQDAAAALAAVERAGVRMQVGFMRRYDPAYAAAMARIEAGEIGEPVLFKSIGRDKDGPPLSAYQPTLNGMLFYASSIHDFDLARWMMRDEVAEVHAFTTAAIRPEVTQYGDVVAGLVNMKFAKGAIGNVESYAQAEYGYDVRTEVVGSLGSILIGSYERLPVTFLSKEGMIAPLPIHFLSRFADAYLAEMSDFVETILNDRAPRVTGLDGLRALEIAIAADQSHLRGTAVKVGVRANQKAVDQSG